MKILSKETFFFILSIILITSAVFASDIKEEEVNKIPTTIPLFYTVQSNTSPLYFSLLGTSHDYPYDWIAPHYRQKIESYDVLVHESKECEGAAKDFLKVCQQRFPSTKEDGIFFKQLIQYLRGTRFESPDGALVLTSETVDKFELCAEKLHLSFGITLEFFRTEVINSHLHKNGIDKKLEDIFKAAKKPVPGLIDPSEQITAYDDDTKITFIQEDAVWLVSHYFLPSTEEPTYPPSLESCAQEFDKALKEGSSLVTRDEQFCIKSLEILKDYPGQNILIMIGCNHLPYMINFFKKQGLSVTKQ